MRIVLVRRKHLLMLAGALLTFAVFWVVNAPATVATSVATRQLPIYCVDRSDNMIAISFDAAWGNEDTQQLIDILARYGVKTTFFVVGEWVDKYPESVRALHEAGHEIMNHSNPHAHYNSLSAQEISHIKMPHRRNTLSFFSHFSYSSTAYKPPNILHHKVITFSITKCNSV